MKFVIINGNSSSEYFRVHGVGCQDIKRDEQKMGNGEGFTVEAENVDRAVENEMAELNEQDGGGWTKSLWTILPCSRKVV